MTFLLVDRTEANMRKRAATITLKNSNAKKKNCFKASATCNNEYREHDAELIHMYYS